MVPDSKDLVFGYLKVATWVTSVCSWPKEMLFGGTVLNEERKIYIIKEFGENSDMKSSF